MKRRFLAIPISVALALSSLVLSTAAFAAGEQAESATASAGRGGEIEVTRKSAGTVVLASNRFTCESCADQVVPQIKSLPGVSKVTYSPFVGSSKHGPAANGLIGTLTITFDPSKTTAMDMVQAAEDALQADPHNRAVVKIVDRTPS
jgi:copper chaperone CopZ